MKYTLGDKWSSDFDYDGMLEMAMETNADWSIDDLKKLSQSFESVNYHSLNENLYNAILEIQNGNKELAQEFLDEFHNDIIKENNEEYEENVQLILSLSYPVISDMCKRNGLVLDEGYYISDGGTEKYHPSIITLKDDKDNIEELSIGYFDYDETTIAYIRIDVREKEAYLDSDFWEVEDAENLNTFYKGGDLEDRGIRPSPKESATIFKAGTRKRGQDGNMWEVTVAKNGVKRWKKISGSESKKESRERKPVPKKSIPKKPEPKKKIEIELSDFDNEQYQELIKKSIGAAMGFKIPRDEIWNQINDFILFHPQDIIIKGKEDSYEFLPTNVIGFIKRGKNQTLLSFHAYNWSKNDNQAIQPNIAQSDGIDFTIYYDLDKPFPIIANFESYGKIKKSYEITLLRIDILIYLIKRCIELNAVDYEYRYIRIKDFVEFFDDYILDTLYPKDKEFQRDSGDDDGNLFYTEPIREPKPELELVNGDRLVLLVDGDNIDWDLMEYNYEETDLSLSSLLKGDEIVVESVFSYSYYGKDGIAVRIMPKENDHKKYKWNNKYHYIQFKLEFLDDLVKNEKIKKIGKLEKQKKREEKKREKTGINDWILDIETAEHTYNIAGWELGGYNPMIWYKSVDDGELHEIIAEPNPETNTTKVIYRYEKKETLAKTIKKGVFASIDEYEEEIRPVIEKIDNILRFEEGGEVKKEEIIAYFKSRQNSPDFIFDDLSLSENNQRGGGQYNTWIDNSIQNNDEAFSGWKVIKTYNGFLDQTHLEEYSNVILEHKNGVLIFDIFPEKNYTLIRYTPKIDGEPLLQKMRMVTKIDIGIFDDYEHFKRKIEPMIDKLYHILKYEHGGDVNDGNYYMLKNQSVQFKHHAEELKKALEDKPKIDAWVVAKAERAATDLSDITHYLEGKNEAKFEEGGDILDQDTLARIDSIDLADASAYEDGGEIRNKQQIQELYKQKVDAVKKLKPVEVVDSWNRNSWSVANGYSKPIGYGEYKPELRMYLANLLFEMELTPEEYSAYMKKGGYVRKTPAKFKDKVSAISKRLEGTQVSPKYRSEYGKFYNREESIEAARKIAGKMIQKEKNK